MQCFNDRSLPRLAFQDEKDLTVQGKTCHQSNHAYSKGRLFNGDYSVKKTSFPWKWWYQQQLLGKQLLGNFLLEKRSKNTNLNLEHLWNEMIPLEKLFPIDNFIFIQDSAPSHRARKVQNFLKDRLNSRFVKNVDWPPKRKKFNRSSGSMHYRPTYHQKIFETILATFTYRLWKSRWINQSILTTLSYCNLWLTTLSYCNVLLNL